ncbi:CocE/NonD family hydrolase [Nonomuraea sp. NPDC050556]|uniref:CocE/NonD family hydrolase n=1 Tax=Nonomuraea sp. NPDC050556 TaxID=3364369 RepID=UPI003795FF5A
MRGDRGTGQRALRSSGAVMSAWTLRSQYVPVRDGTRLAVYLFLPAQAGPYPVVWAHDRYHQVTPRAQREDHLAAIRRQLADESVADLGIDEVSPMDISLRSFPLAERLIGHGYAVAVVDSRGSGASFGCSDGPFAVAEMNDVYDVTEWLAAQPWCTGRVGMFGRSYLGVSQYLAAIAAPPSLCAVFPQMALYDLYSFAYDGGIFRGDFARAWGADVAYLDQAGPVAPLDDDPDGALLAAARAEHTGNRDVYGMFASLRDRDAALPGSTERPYVTRSPAAMIEAIRTSHVAIHHLGGWYDVWARDAVRWAEALPAPHRVTIGPWPHTGGLMGGAGLNLADEHVRWFDHWLKGVDNDVTDGPRIRYAIDGAPGWVTTDTWPPRDVESQQWELGIGGWLAPEPGPAGIGQYPVDYATTTGRTSRWASGYGAPYDYPNLAGNDARAYTYTSAPLDRDFDVVGEPVLHLTLSAPQPDVHVFAYLEAVASDGTSRYVTEGCLRLGPDTKVTITLHPAAYRFAVGTRLRLALTGADADNAETPIRHPAPVLAVRHGTECSALTLPVRTAPTSVALTTAQRGIWLAEQGGDTGWSYHLGAAYEMSGPVDIDALANALDEVVQRHKALRTTICEVDGELVARVHSPARLDWTRLDLRGLAADQDWTRDDRVRQITRTQFDLGREWPIRAATARLVDGGIGLIVVLHHVAADPVAAEIVLSELATLYAAYADGKPSLLPPVVNQYVDLAREQAEWMAGPDFRARLTSQLEALSGAPDVVALPLDQPRPDRADHRGGTIAFELPDATKRHVEALAADARTTPFAILLGAFAHTLSRYGAGNDLIIGTPVVDRAEDTAQGVVGCLANLVPIRLRLNLHGSVGDLLSGARAAVLTALSSRAVPFDALVAASGVKRDPAVAPFVQVSFRLGTRLADTHKLGDVELRRVPMDEGASKFDLSLAVDSIGDRYEGALHYRSTLFNADTASRIAETFLAMLDQLEPEASLADLDTVSRRDLGLMFGRWQPVLPPDGSPRLARCYVLDAARCPVPIGGVGELYVSGEGSLADPYADEPGTTMHATGVRARWTGDGRLSAMPTVNRVDTTIPVAAAEDDPLRAEIAQLWAELLAIPSVGSSEDFFDLGGDSLSAIRLIGRLRRAFNVRLTLRDVFAAPTPAAQAALIAERRAV